MKAAVIITAAGQTFAVEIDRDPPLGWRFWTFAGFPQDPIEPRPYGGSRGIPLCLVDTDHGERWLTAMELDWSAQLFAPHDLFPCPNQEGAETFGLEWIERHSEQLSLF